MQTPHVCMHTNAEAEEARKSWGGWGSPRKILKNKYSEIASEGISFLAFVDCFISCSIDFAVDCYNRAFSCPVAMSDCSIKVFGCSIRVFRSFC